MKPYATYQLHSILQYLFKNSTIDPPSSCSNPTIPPSANNSAIQSYKYHYTLFTKNECLKHKRVFIFVSSIYFWCLRVSKDIAKQRPLTPFAWICFVFITKINNVTTFPSLNSNHMMCKLQATNPMFHHAVWCV